MTTEGVWKMTEDGQFELQEPYATYLNEAKRCATQGWREAFHERDAYPGE